MTSAAAAFRRFPWLLSGHMETVAAAFSASPAVEYERRIVSTPDGDEIALDYVAGRADMPLLAVFHGLEGCSESRTIRLLASGFAGAGWTVAVPHFRSCGGHMNRLPRAYHAADTADVGWMLDYCRGGFAHAGMFAAGVSLGGTALLHYLAQQREAPLAAAAGVCVPFNLPACVQALDSGLNRRLYARHFLKRLRAKILQKLTRYPSLCDAGKLRRARTIGEFDALYTAPVHGFADADAYWRKASVWPHVLTRINRPLLCINALNDPLIAAETLPPDDGRRDRITHCRPKHGGHGGFFGTPDNWLFNTVHRFFTASAS